MLIAMFVLSVLFFLGLLFVGVAAYADRYTSFSQDVIAIIGIGGVMISLVAGIGLSVLSIIFFVTSV